jgi:hypothetical protein
VQNRASYSLRPPNPKLDTLKIKGQQWTFPEKDYDYSDVDPTFELGNEIETFNYAGLVKVILSDGIPRIVEDEDAEDSNTDS